jgi:hypothetical protein
MPHVAPKCAIADVAGFNVDARVSSLDPFDSSDVRRQSNVFNPYCLFRGDAVPCDQCPAGVTYERGSYACAPPSSSCQHPKDCERCTFNPDVPQRVVPCDSCLDRACDSRGKCRCVM